MAIGQTRLQPTANHTIDRIVATSTHADNLDAGIAPCMKIRMKLKGSIASFGDALDASNALQHPDDDSSLKCA